MKENKEITHLTSVHTRYDTRIFSKECISLAKNYKVNLIVADGLGNEIIKNIHIYDVGKKDGRLNRFLNTQKIFKKAIELDSDIYHFHDPELIFVGLKLKRNGGKVIYDIHEDLVKQILFKGWIPKFLRKTISFIFEKFENIVVEKFDSLIVPQPIMLESYSAKNKNTILVENFVVIDEDEDLLLNKNNSQICFHPGVLVEERGLTNMINAFSLLDDSNKLILAGRLNDTDLLKIKKINNITYMGIIPYSEVTKLYKEASIGLILYNNVAQYHLSYSIKLFEFMKNSIPVIMPNFGEWVKFNEINNCGINVDPKNSKEVSSAINFLNSNIEEKNKLGRNGRKSVMEKYNWGNSEKKLLEAYKILFEK